MTIFKFYTYYLILVIDQVKMHSANYTLRTLLFCIPLIHAFDKIYCTKGTHLYSIWKEWYLKIKSDFVLIGLVLLRIMCYIFTNCRHMHKLHSPIGKLWIEDKCKTTSYDESSRCRNFKCPADANKTILSF